MSNRAESIESTLRALVSHTPDVEGAALVTTDGLIVSSVLPTTADEDRVAAMAAALLALGERTSKELTRGMLDQVYVKGADGYVVLMRVGEDCVLEAIAGSAAKLGMVLLDMKRSTKELETLV